MNIARLDTFAWVAIYVGIGLIALGISLVRGAAGFGWVVAGFGAIGVAGGVVMIWIRSRHQDRA